mgnify:CR=1 FL=1
MKIQTFTIVAGTRACNAKCPYCISKMTPSQGVEYKLQKTNWKNFEKACRLAQTNNVSTVLITGKGEPLLYPKQTRDFLKKMKPYDFPLIEVQTNGLVFKNWEQNLNHFKKYHKLGLNTMAISIAHYDKEKNKQIFCPRSEYPDLEKTIEKLHNLGYSIRLSCIMLKGYIDSVKEIKKLVDFCKKNRVEQLTVRSVTVPKKSINKKVYDWTKKRVLSKKVLLKISKYLEKEGDKLMTLDHGGVVYDLNGQNICLSDCLTIKSNTEDLRQLIFFPDGHLRYDWQYRGATLL